MKTTCLLYFLLFTVVSLAGAQTLKVGVKGGVSIPQLRAAGGDNSFSTGYRSLARFQAGLIAEYQISSLFSLQTELNYSTQGGTKNGLQRISRQSIQTFLRSEGIALPSTFGIPEFSYVTVNGTVPLVYLELPIMAKFNVNTSNSTILSVFGGPYVGYLLKAEGKSVGKSKIYSDPAQTNELTYPIGTVQIPFGVLDLDIEREITEECNRINYGFQGGISFTYQLPVINIFVAAGGTYGLRFVQRDPNFGQNKTGGATVSLGASLKL